MSRPLVPVDIQSGVRACVPLVRVRFRDLNLSGVFPATSCTGVKKKKLRPLIKTHAELGYENHYMSI